MIPRLNIIQWSINHFCLVKWWAIWYSSLTDLTNLKNIEYYIKDGITDHGDQYSLDRYTVAKRKRPGKNENSTFPLYNGITGSVKRNSVFKDRVSFYLTDLYLYENKFGYQTENFIFWCFVYKGYTYIWILTMSLSVDRF